MRERGRKRQSSIRIRTRLSDQEASLGEECASFVCARAWDRARLYFGVLCVRSFVNFFVFLFICVNLPIGRWACRLF